MRDPELFLATSNMLVDDPQIQKPVAVHQLVKDVLVVADLVPDLGRVAVRPVRLVAPSVVGAGQHEVF